MNPPLGRDFDTALAAVMGDLAVEVDALHASLIEERLALDQGDAQALDAGPRATSSTGSRNSTSNAASSTPLPVSTASPIHAGRPRSNGFANAGVSTKPMAVSSASG